MFQNVRLIFQEYTVKTHASQLLYNLHEFIIQQNKNTHTFQLTLITCNIPGFRKLSISFLYLSCHLVSLLMEIVVFIEIQLMLNRSQLLYTPSIKSKLDITYMWEDFPGGAVVKNPPGDRIHLETESGGDTRGIDLIPGLERSPGERSGNLFQCSCLGNPMDRGA